MAPFRTGSGSVKVRETGAARCAIASTPAMVSNGIFKILQWDSAFRRTLDCLVKSPLGGNVRHFDNLETACIFGKGIDNGFRGRLGANSAPDRVAGFEESLNGAGGDVPIGTGDEDKTVVRHGGCVWLKIGVFVGEVRGESEQLDGKGALSGGGLLVLAVISELM